MTSAFNTSPIETLIDVGGCRLNFTIFQGSETTILFEVGGGADSSMYTSFLEHLTQETGATVVTYDRAGFGKSDLPSKTYNQVEETHWLMNGLHQLNLSDDLFMMGHSYGGWRIRLTASMFPGAVAGMIFVDPFTTEFVDRLGVDYLDQHPMCPKDPPFDTSNPKTLTKNQRGLFRMVKEGLGPKVEVMRATSIPKAIPVRIITSGEPWWHTSKESLAWREAHEQMAASIPDAVLIVAEGCDHLIPEKQPELIVQAVEDVIRLAKSG
jgi:pimeloyl-ACP methyl ester carboxylesterase